MYSRESSALLKIQSYLSCLRALLNLLILNYYPNSCPAYPTYCFEDFTQPHLVLFFPLPLPQPPFPQDGSGVPFGSLAVVAPSIAAISSSFLLDLFVLPDLPGPPVCFFPVINLLNGVILHLNSAAQPV